MSSCWGNRRKEPGRVKEKEGGALRATLNIWIQLFLNLPLRKSMEPLMALNELNRVSISYIPKIPENTEPNSSQDVW